MQSPKLCLYTDLQLPSLHLSERKGRWEAKLLVGGQELRHRMHSYILWWWGKGNQKSWTCPTSGYITSPFTPGTDSDKQVLFSLLFPSSVHHVILLTTCLCDCSHAHSGGTSTHITEAATSPSPVSWSVLRGCKPYKAASLFLLEVFTLFLLWIHLVSTSRLYALLCLHLQDIPLPALLVLSWELCVCPFPGSPAAVGQVIKGK